MEVVELGTAEIGSSGTIGMDGAGGLPDHHQDNDHVDAEEVEARSILEKADVSETDSGGCPSCGAPSPCSTWLKITLGFTAAKAVAR